MTTTAPDIATAAAFLDAALKPMGRGHRAWNLREAAELLEDADWTAAAALARAGAELAHALGEEDTCRFLIGRALAQLGAY